MPREYNRRKKEKTWPEYYNHVTRDMRMYIQSYCSSVNQDNTKGHKNNPEVQKTANSTGVKLDNTKDHQNNPEIEEIANTASVKLDNTNDHQINPEIQESVNCTDVKLDNTKDHQSYPKMSCNNGSFDKTYLKTDKLKTSLQNVKSTIGNENEKFKDNASILFDEMMQNEELLNEKPENCQQPLEESGYESGIFDEEMKKIDQSFYRVN